MSDLLYASQYFTTTLSVSGGINDSQTTDIVFQAVSGIAEPTKPGLFCLSYADPLDTDDAEWCTYTSVNTTTKEAQGVVRGEEGSTAKAHANGVTVAFPFTKAHINRINDKLTGADTIDNDLDLAATMNIKQGGADPYRTIVIPAGSMSPTTTAGCADAVTVETTTNKINYKVLDFDKATEEHAFCNWPMPISWDGGTLLVKFEWTSTAATGDVVWGVEGRAFANDDAADQAVGTAQTVTDTITAAADFDFTAETSALTLAGTPAGGQSVYLQVFRKAADAADTLDADARLKSVIIRYKVGQFSD